MCLWWRNTTHLCNLAVPCHWQPRQPWLSLQIITRSGILCRGFSGNCNRFRMLSWNSKSLNGQWPNILHKSHCGSSSQTGWISGRLRGEFIANCHTLVLTESAALSGHRHHHLHFDWFTQKVCGCHLNVYFKMNSEPFKIRGWTRCALYTDYVQSHICNKHSHHTLRTHKVQRYLATVWRGARWPLKRCDDCPGA